MRLSTFASPVLTAIFACGPGQPAGTDTDPSTGSTSEATAASTTVVPTTSTTATGPVETTGEPVPGTTAEPATSTTDPATSTTEPATGTTEDPSTGGPPDAAFAAQFWSGGLDHLDARMADLKADLCVSIHFARPGGSPRPGLTLPPDWWYQGATISQGVADCLDFEASLPDIVAAASVAGDGAWDTAEFCPKALDLDLVLTFPQGQPWLPAEVTVAAAAIPVQGC